MKEHITWAGIADTLAQHQRVLDTAWARLADELSGGIQAHDHPIVGRHLLIADPATWEHLIADSRDAALQAGAGAGIAMLGLPVFVLECPCSRVPLTTISGA